MHPTRKAFVRDDETHPPLCRSVNIVDLTTPTPPTTPVARRVGITASSTPNKKMDSNRSPLSLLSPNESCGPSTTANTTPIPKGKRETANTDYVVYKVGDGASSMRWSRADFDLSPEHDFFNRTRAQTKMVVTRVQIDLQRITQSQFDDLPDNFLHHTPYGVGIVCKKVTPWSTRMNRIYLERLAESDPNGLKRNQESPISTN